MKNFILQETKFGYVCFSLTYIHPMNYEYLDELTKELKDISFIGDLIFDGLTSNGDSFNRFVKANFNGFSFDFNTFTILDENVIKYERHCKEENGGVKEFSKEDLEKECNQFYTDNFNLLRNTILSKDSLIDIKNGFFK